MTPSQAPLTRARLAERLAANRRRQFVGRAAELALLQQALRADPPPFAVLYLYGPGGIGKTSLLHQYAHLAEEQGLLVARLDGRALDRSPAAFLGALRAALHLDATTEPISALARAERALLLVDTYEAIAPLEAWLRERFLPELPAQTLVVLAGRNPPSAAWRADAAWRNLVRIVALRNLRPDESETYLRECGVPAAQIAHVLACTHGHPLALALVGEVLTHGDAQPAFALEQAPDIVQLLLDRLVQAAPSAQHRLALHICAHVRVTTEALLRDALAHDDVHDLFAWLRSLSFIEPGPEGLFPHDLTRDLLDHDLRWRDPERYAALHRRVRQHFVRRLAQTQGTERIRAFFDIMFLHRANPVMQPYFDFKALGSVYAEPASPEDHAAIVALVARHQGAEGAALVRYWLGRQPHAFSVARGGGREVQGCSAELELQAVTPEDLADPLVNACWGYAQRQAPLRPGETLLVLRLFLDAEHGQRPTPIVSLFQIAANVRWVSTPHLALTFITMADPAFWRPVMQYIDFAPVPEADLELDGRSYGAFVHDWRAVDVTAWLALTGERELATDLTPEALAAQQPPALLVLSQPEFTEAVRQALRAYHRPEALAHNPLARSRLVTAQPAATPVATLRALIEAAAAALQATPRDQKLYRAIHATYLEPAATQEQAAERLNLPFSTYRSHLSAGVERVVAWLWQREVAGGNMAES